MRALVIGLGSMGKRRIRCLQRHAITEIVGFDSRADRCETVAQEYGVEALKSLSMSDIADYDLIIVSTPPDHHHTYMAWAVDVGRPCFVEASVILAPLPAIRDRANQKGVLIAPSCTLRFHPAIRDITAITQSGRYGKVCNFSYHCGQYLPDWHPWEKVADYYVSNPATGGAREIVPFELTWLVAALGWPDKAMGLCMRTTEVGAPIDDTYIALLQYENFAGSLVVDVVARQAVRHLILNLEHASLSWDWTEGVVRVYEALTQRTIAFHQAVPNAHAGYHPNIGEAMYVEETGSFLRAAAGQELFPHSLQDDIRVLELLEQIESSERTAYKKSASL